MKKIYMFIGILVVAVVFTGCYRHTPKEVAAPADVKEVALDMASPSKKEADVIIITHVKKRQTEDSYTFTFFVDGKEIKESVKGEKEKESNLAEERGEGVHFALIKRLRVKPGVHEIALKSEEGYSSKIERELTVGKIYTVRFEPIYGPARFGRPKNFREGLMYFEIYFDIGNLLIE